MESKNIFEKLQTECGLVADQASFERAFACSDFFRGQMRRWEEIVDQQSPQFCRLKVWLPRWFEPCDVHWLKAEVDKAFALSSSDRAWPEGVNQVMAHIRFTRLLFQVRSVYREFWLIDQADVCFLDQMREYSAFADLIIRESERYLRDALSQQMSLENVPSPMIIFALGKLGAEELNLSSDVDLIFCFDSEQPELVECDQSLSEFYMRLGQRLIRFLTDVTQDGFVFRIDMRLRPFGQSGPLVWPTNSLEAYYQHQGRMWERYAWSKARLVTGGVAGFQLGQNLNQFVYRRYVDFNVFDSLREMKTLIEREVKRTDAQNNIKIGQGGIREVEFIVQVVQLVRGGEYPDLQVTSLFQAMDVIEYLCFLPSKVIRELRDSYLLLRRIEHFLQSFQDQQTQVLPKTDEGWSALTLALKVDNPTALDELIKITQLRIHEHFLATIRPQMSMKLPADVQEQWADVWPDQLDQIHDEAIRLQLEAFRDSRSYFKASEIAKHRLELLFPMVLGMLSTLDSFESVTLEATLSHQLHVSLPELEICWYGLQVALSRFLSFLDSILRRPTYIALLTENPNALLKVLKLCGTSAFLTELVTRYPSLLEELLDETPKFHAPTKSVLTDEMRQQLNRIPEDDFEQQINSLRAFKQRHTLRAAMADISGELPLMNVSDYLTWLAESLLQASLEIAWRNTVLKYGQPELFPGSHTGFLIVGYGKLGGIEMSYTSDLDLVFLYDAPIDGETDGRRAIENSVFYAQLIKNLNHILMTNTLDGRLYEIDMRLRPSGSKGLFVSTFESFRRYQSNDAWVWERQAFVRARPVAGDQHLFDRFVGMREQVLAQVPKNAQLIEGVLSMRKRLQSHFKVKPGQFHLKYSPSALVDIEFLAQHIVLSCAEKYPAMAGFPDNVRIFQLAGVLDIISHEDAVLLTEAYLIYRALIHRLSLQNESSIVGGEELLDIRNGVKSVFNRWFSLKDAREWQANRQ